MITAFAHDSLDQYISLVSQLGTAVILGLPEHPVNLSLAPLVVGHRCIAGSLIGSVNEVQEMLEFSAKHDVKPWVNVMPMEEVNDAIKLVREGKPRYRIVLEKTPNSFADREE